MPAGAAFTYGSAKTGSAWVRDTLPLRLMGATRVRVQALRDLLDVPEDAWKRWVAHPWLVRLSFELLADPWCVRSRPTAELLPFLFVRSGRPLVELLTWAATVSVG